jgi:hypothetical protein
MRTKQIICALACIGGTALLSLGCVAHAQAGGYGEADAPVAFTEPPTLVEIDTDVWVVRDYDYPVYYVEGSYWVYRDNVWWRSTAYDKGWARADVNVVPAVVVHRDHRAYVHYHGTSAARTRPGPREHLASDHDSHRGPPDQPGSPGHAGDHHGPPGHDEVPGIGNQHRAEEGNAGNAQHEDKRDDRKIGHDDRKEERRDDKKEEKRDDKKDDKKGGPKKK